MKEGGGDDNLALAWQYPGQSRVVIPASYSRVMNPALIGATLDSWTGIGGISIADLMSGTNNLVNTANKSVRLVGLLEGPSNVDDNYGSRMNGWLVPPVSGGYKFWIASDDNGELWLSTNDDPANKALACHQPWSAGSRHWTRYPEQESKLISLVAGRAYFYEVRESVMFTIC